MENLDPETIRTLSVETGFRAESLEKVIRLGGIASQIGPHPLLGSTLVLKGGTALNLFFGPPPRLSVDLDFNYVGAPDRDGMLRERPRIEKVVEDIGRSQGYLLQRSGDDHAGRKIYFSYVNLAGIRDRIEIDLNFVHRIGFGSTRKEPMWQPGEFPRPELTLAGLEDICAGKLCALMSRCRPRDLYDATRLPKIAIQFWHSHQFKRLFVAFSGMLDHPLHAYKRERLNRVDQAQVDMELVSMLAGRGPASASELVEQAWAAVGHLMDLDDAEREFVDRLQLGELRPELLFPDDALLADRVAQFPPLLWKVQNARKHKAAGP